MNKRKLLCGDNLCLSPRPLLGRTFAAVATQDLRQMRYFTAVAERGSFTGAARELHVAQQAVSQQVKALEQLLGVTLLERSSRRVELTPEGVIFLADFKHVLAGADRAARRVQAAARGGAGPLRLVYTLVSAFETVPRLLDRLDHDYPLLKVDAPQRRLRAQGRPTRSRLDRLGLHRRRPRRRPRRQLVDRAALPRGQASRPRSAPPDAHRQRRLATGARASRDRALLRNRVTTRAGASPDVAKPSLDPRRLLRQQAQLVDEQRVALAQQAARRLPSGRST